VEFRGIDSSSTPVKILIDISPEYYDRILSEFTENSRRLLKNLGFAGHVQGLCVSE
jgi:hypothetical protein